MEYKIVYKNVKHNFDLFHSWPQAVKFIFPLFIIVTGIDFSWIQLYIFFW